MFKNKKRSEWKLGIEIEKIIQKINYDGKVNMAILKSDEDNPIEAIEQLSHLIWIFVFPTVILLAIIFRNSRK